MKIFYFAADFDIILWQVIEFNQIWIKFDSKVYSSGFLTMCLIAQLNQN